MLPRRFHAQKDICSCLVVQFRLIVFRPYKGEILEGVIAESSVQGIKSMSQTRSLPHTWQSDKAGSAVQLDFFDDVWVPGPSNLFEGSRLYVRPGRPYQPNRGTTQAFPL